MGVILIEYLGLFAASFAAATLVPFPSEGVLVGFLALGFDPFWCILIATVGNTLGGLTNYFIGWLLGSGKRINANHLKESSINRWRQKSNKWGHYLGLLGWVPFVGDPMILVLGFLKVKFWPLALMIFIGKLIRYLILSLVFYALV